MKKFRDPDTAALVAQRLSQNAGDADALFVLAAIHVRDGKLAEGLDVLDRVLRIDPKYPGAWRFKATLHRMRDQGDAEQSALKSAEDAER